MTCFTDDGLVFKLQLSVVVVAPVFEGYEFGWSLRVGIVAFFPNVQLFEGVGLGTVKALVFHVVGKSERDELMNSEVDVDVFIC